MKLKHYITLFLAFIFISQNITQPVDCGVPGPPGSDNCPDACVYCDLTSNGYVGSTIGYTPDPPNNYCGTIENNQWFAFAAGTTTVEFTIIASNCLNGDGVQGAIYSGCPQSGPPIACEGGSNNGENIPIVVTANNLVVGTIYWFMVDGWLGDECDYNVTVTQGNTDPPALGPPGPITGPLSGCAGDMVTYTIPPLTGASYYEWTLPDGTIVSGPDPFVDYTFGVGGQVCVEATNVCNFSPQVCIDVVLVVPDAGTLSVTPTTLCPNEITNITVTGYNSDPEFTQAILVTDATGIIISITNNTGTSTFTHDACDAFQICSYSYITAQGPDPVIGNNINTLNCSNNCCDLTCQSISFEDNQAPVFSNPPADETLSCFDLLSPMVDQTWTDNCDGTGTVSGVETGSGDLCNGGSIVRTWQYTDLCGNLASFEQNITINASPPPIFDNLPTDMTVDCDNIPTSGIDLTYTNNGSGACLISGTVSPVETGTGDVCGGTITYTWDFTDACGNAITHSQNITITPAPAAAFVNPPGDLTFDCDNIPTSAPDLDYTNNGAGNCLFDGSVSPTQSVSADICGGAITYTWDFTDPCGNAITHSQNITITPAPAPAFINPPTDVTLSCDNIPGGAPDLDYSNAGSGSCLFSGSVSPTQSGSADICGGTITYTWDYTDPCGNSITHSQNITITPAPPAAFINPPADATFDCDNIPSGAPNLDYTNNAPGACLFDGNVAPTQSGSADICGGTITYTWNYTDPCGNAITHSQNITITPALPPGFINPPPDATFDCDNVPNSAPNLDYTNNGSGACLFDGSVAPTQSGNADVCGGTIIYIWDYTDPCSNNISYTQTQTVNPAPSPSFTNPPSDETITCGDPIPPFTGLDYDNGITGLCAISGTVSGTENNNYDACGGSINRNWSYTDPCSNTITHSQTITISPGPPPVFGSLPADLNLTCGDLIPPLTDLSYDNGVSGFCAVSGLAPGIESGSYDACGGALTRTWTYSNACNNITHTQTINIAPAPAPNFTNLPPNETVNCGEIPQIVSLSYTNGIGGVCNLSGTVPGQESGTYDACGGTLSRIWNTTDVCGNPLNYTQTITVSPAPPPAFINPPADVNVGCDEIPASDLSYDNGASGICNISGTLSPTETGTYDACGGSLNRTWTFTDPCGNTITHNQTITIDPSGPPAFTNPPVDITVNCNSIPQLAPLSYSNNSFGACLTSGGVDGIESGDVDLCGGTLTRTWTFTDPCGYTITHSQNVTVNPPPAPNFVNPPPNITITCGDPLPNLTNLFFTNNQTGNCAMSGNATGMESGSYDACGGSLTRTWTANSNCGLTLEHTQIITINPAPAPNFVNPPADIQIDCGNIPTLQDLFYTNGLSGFCEISGSASGTETGSYTGCGGSLTRNWNVTDLCGNTITYSQTITVNPANPPQYVNLPGDITLNCGETPPPMNDLFYDNGSIGNCGIGGTVSGVESGSFDLCGGQLTRTWDFTDACGNTISHTQYITSLPAPAPVFELPNQGNVIDCGEDYPMTSLTYHNGASGICEISGAVLGIDESDGLPCQEEITRTWSYTDPCGNFIEEVETYYILDIEPPTMDPPPPNQILPCSGTVPPMTTLGWWDNCEGTGTVVGVDVSDGGNPETITRTWEYIDACGNSDFATQTFTVNNFEILQAQVGLCNNQGTLSDPDDDTFSVTVDAGIGQAGPSNQYTVTDGTTIWGPFTYGSPASIPGLSANGNTYTLTFTDVDDPACFASITVSQVSCSTDCQLMVEPYTQSDCDENGTPSDPSDDFFDLFVNASATNGGSNYQFTVTNGTTTWGPFDYGTGGDITDLPANGNTLTLTFSDVDIPGCSNQLQISSNPCSSICLLTITNSLIGPCQNQGTPSDPTDDTFNLTVNATAQNPGATNQFTVTDGTTTWGPFTYGTGGVITGLPANGSNITLTFSDIDDSACSASVDVSQTSCSDLCVLSVDAATVLPCNNNGTDADPNDDFFEVTVNASALNPGSNNQFTVTNGTTTWGPFDYGVGGIVGPLAANGNNLTLTFTDVDITACAQQIQVSSNPCSSSCVLTIDQLASGLCDDQGTPSDPNDDIFNVTVNASAINPGASGQFTVTDGTAIWGPFDYGVGGMLTGLPADGTNINLVFTDVDDISCNASATVTSASCSDLCVFTIKEATIGSCNDNGTDADPVDDFYAVTVNASAINAGASNQFTVTDGITTWGPFDYGVGGMIPGLPANGNNITLIFTDTDNNTCTQQVQVSSNPCSSSCILVIDQVLSADCNDEGTPSDPNDDTFEVTVNASATNPGASGQFIVTDGTTTWGPFDYGVGGILSDLPANGTSINLVFTDVDDNSCNATAVVTSASCSDLCVLSLDEATAGPCQNNGTITDPDDDTFNLTVNASALNPGSSGQFTVTDGTNTWGPFGYGTGGVITGLSANGNNTTFTFEDIDDAACSANTTIVQFPCSSSCILTIDQLVSADCDDQGTPSDPADDTFEVTVNASAINPGASGQFTITDGTTIWGPFDYAVGGVIAGLPANGIDIILIVSDADDTSCNASTIVSSEPCSDLCILTIDQAIAGACNDNGTDADASDDTFEVTINASAINPGTNNQFTVTDGTTVWGPFDYGVGGTIPGLSANGTNITLTFEDTNNGSCSQTVNVIQLPCSSSCIFSIDQIVTADCSGQGTPSDPDDDTFEVTVNASAINPGASGQFNVTDGTTIWGPFDYGVGGVIAGLPANGNNITLTFSDADDISCNASANVTSDPCSDLCVLSIDQAIAGACDNNGTDTDANDDTFDVTVNATAVNPGTNNQFTVTDGTTVWGLFDYGVGGTIPGLPANGTNITLTFEDTNNGSCSQTVNIMQLPCSSSCIFSIDQIVTADCSGQGTPSDPDDDTFEVTVNASAINPGASGQFNVTDGTTIWGPFDYGVGGVIAGLPANGNNITLTFSDADDISCNASANVTSDPCSDLCVLSIDQAIAGACDNNGTDTDANDDTFDVTVNATAVNPGTNNQFTVTDGTTVWGLFDYGVGGTIPGLPANGTNITLTFEDTNNGSCSQTVNIMQLPCSSSCIFSIDQIVTADCSDQGTPSDPNDDTFDVTVNASAINPGASGQFNVTDGTTIWGPFDYGVGGVIAVLPANGNNITLTFSDADDISCNASANVTSDPCSDLCVLSIDQAIAGACDNNGTDTDANDDTFDVTVNATAVNPGTNNQFTVTDGTTVWGPFDYGVGGTIPGLPANGTNITLTFEDTNNGSCSQTVNIMQLPCSSSCIFSIDQIVTADCSDQGTPSDPNDDTFDVTVNASAINPGASGQFNVTDGTTIWGPFDYGVGGVIAGLPANGNNITLTFSDADDISCNASANVVSEPCSDLCVLIIDQALAGVCDDNGTDADGSDDTFEVIVNASAINPGINNQFTVTDGTTIWGPFDYGVGGTIPGLPANGTNITFTFEDTNNGSCSQTVNIMQLPCSSSCIFSIDQIVTADCSDQGTPSDPNDDTFDVTVNASAINPGASGQFNVTDGTTIWGPFDYGVGGVIAVLPANGNNITLTFSDADDISCNASANVTSDPCSDLCVLSIDQAIAGACDNNGTDTDANDDTFDVTVNATAVNPGTNNQFTVTDGTTVWGLFDYGVGGTIPGLPANGTNITLTFEDTNNGSCSQTVNIMQLPCSSSCIFSIDQIVTADCSGQGTPSDPDDDTFEVTVNASAINPGASGQFNVTDGTTIWGPFDYGVGGVIAGLPANGNNITLTFSDADDISCNASANVTSDPCSDLCVLSIDQAIAGACDNNGTDTDANDDTFDVTVNATAVNPGTNNQFTVTDGTTVWGLFDYGVGGTIPGLPANGTNITLTFEDTNNGSCSQTVNIMQLPCSSSCIFSIDQIVTADCSDQGTPSDPNDDTFDVTVNASAINPGASGQFNVTDGTTIWGPFDYGVGGVIAVLPANGNNITLTFSDADDISCNASANVTSDPCSDLCVLSIDQAIAGACDNNGTDTDANDDTFDVTVNATAVNPGTNNQFTVTDGTTVWGPFDYGVGGTIPGLPANGTNITLTFEDTNNGSCSQTVNIMQLPCSSSCIFSIDQIVTADCSDQGTPSDPNDDTFDVTVNASAINPGASGQFNVTDGTTIWGPFDYGVGGVIAGLPANGNNITLTFSDADDISCNASANVVSEPCSDLCVLIIDQALAGVCDDNGTDADGSDDTFEVIVNASAINPGINNQFTVTDGTTIWGPFDYGVGGTIPGLPANGTNITFTFEDTNNGSCSQTVNIMQLPCSSSCIFSIDQIVTADCSDQGTPSDPNDDTFDVTVNASAINPGASGQFNVTDGTTIWGPFDYGVGGVIAVLPANGNNITLTFSDADDISCNASANVVSEPCSDLCDLIIDQVLAGVCDDNGTDADGSDDTFEVIVNASAINPGINNQFTVTDGTTIWGPFDYGVGGTISGLPADGNLIALTFEDTDDMDCSQIAHALQFPCSSACVFSIDQVLSADCNDQGTPSDPSDDTFEVTVNASTINPGTSGQFNIFDGTNTWGPFDYGIGGVITGLPANGTNITLTFTDSDDIGCNDSAIVSSESCSDLCVFTIDEALVGPCDNLGSLANTDDDIFEVTVNATAINPGSNNQFTVTDGITISGPFSYGVGGIITGLSADGNIITLTFMDIENAMCTSSIDVSQQPCSECDLIIDAGPDQLINCANPIVQLFGSSSEPALYEWIGPGINANNQNQEQPMVDQPGLYTLTVSNLNTGCVEMADVVVDFIDDAPVAVATGGEITCETATIQLSSAGSSTGPSIVYTWSGPDPDLDINSPSPETSIGGIYVLVTTDTTTNCVSQPDTVQIGTNTAPPTAIINLIGSLTCISIGALIDGAGSSVGDSIQYQWLFEEEIIPGATDISYQATQQGTYTFVVLNIFNGCDASDSLFVEDDMTYPIAIAADPELLTCYADSVQLDGTGSTNLVQITYEWSGPVGGILSGGNTTMPWVGLPGEYILSVVDTLNGCENLDTIIVNQDIASPLADAGEDVDLDCISLEAGLDGTNSSTGNPYTFEWLEGSGNIVSGIGTLQPIVNAPGDYTLVITNLENGCTATDNVLVAIPTGPTDIVYSAADPICFGEQNGSIVIDSVIGGQAPYTYSLDNQIFSSNNAFSFLSSGTYTINISDDDGCTFQTSITLEEGNNVYIVVSDDETIDLGDSISLNAFVNIPPSYVDSLQWLPLDDETLSCYNCYDPIAKPFRTTIYSATVWDLDGCWARDEVTINVLIDRSVYIPRAFSPNGDGINDKFMIYAGQEVLRINSFQIYSRWGEEIFNDFGFQPNDPAHGWDGTLRGEPMNPAVFAYWAEIEFVDGYKKFYKGDVTLVK